MRFGADRLARRDWYVAEGIVRSRIAQTAKQSLARSAVAAPWGHLDVTAAEYRCTGEAGLAGAAPESTLTREPPGRRLGVGQVALPPFVWLCRRLG